MPFLTFDNNMQAISFTFTDLSLEETNAILAALQELPGKICNPISEKLKQQAQPQIEAFQKAQAEPQQEAKQAGE